MMNIAGWIGPLPLADLLFAFNHSNFVSGKLFVFGLFLVSIYAWAVMVIKFLELRQAKRASRHFLVSFRKEQHPLGLFLKRQSFAGTPLFKIYENACLTVGVELEARGNAPGELFVRGLEKPVRLNPYQITAVRNAAERTIADQALVLESKMGILATAASAAPLVGLLGTVWGVMDTFSSMAVEGAASIAAVAPGISGALMTTGAALVVAIPSAVGYNYLANEVRSMAVRMDNFADEFMANVQRQFMTSQD